VEDKEPKEIAAGFAEIRAERAHEIARRIAQGSANRGELNCDGCELHFMEVARISVAIVDAVDAELKKAAEAEMRQICAEIYAVEPGPLHFPGKKEKS
jgi:hypothetical protein